MTLTKKALSHRLNSMRVFTKNDQKVAILDRFGAEPFPYEWLDQDIAVQIRNFLDCGEFVKSAPSDYDFVSQLHVNYDDDVVF